MSADIYPSEIRRQIFEQHKALRAMLEVVQDLAHRVLAGEADAGDPLRREAEELYEAVCRHLDVEDAFLAPALRETDAFGPDRANELLHHHQQQRTQLAEAIRALHDTGHKTYEIATDLLRLVHELRIDMAHEEKDLLDEKLLRDDPITTDIFTG